MDDVRAVMDAAGSERAAVFGVSEGGTDGILFAATYPERVRALVLTARYAKRRVHPTIPWAPPEQRSATRSCVERDWGGRDRHIAVSRPAGSDEPSRDAWARFHALPRAQPGRRAR